MISQPLAPGIMASDGVVLAENRCDVCPIADIRVRVRRLELPRIGGRGGGRQFR